MELGGLMQNRTYSKKKKRMSRDKKLKITKSFIVNSANENELIELIELMRLRKKSLDLKKIARDKAKLTSKTK